MTNVTPSVNGSQTGQKGHRRPKQILHSSVQVAPGGHFRVEQGDGLTSAQEPILVLTEHKKIVKIYISHNSGILLFVLLLLLLLLLKLLLPLLPIIL